MPLLLLLAALTSDPGPAFDRLSAADLAYLSREGTLWVRRLETESRPLARALTPEERRAMGGFFSAGLLERARVRHVERIENPEFLSLFADRGLPLPIDFHQASGLALEETILIAGHAAEAPGWQTLLFHELVHLVQVEVLGKDRHVEDYVRGWAEHGHSYRSIPQEEQAYELAARFRRAPRSPFSVRAAVERRFGR